MEKDIKIAIRFIQGVIGVLLSLLIYYTCTQPTCKELVKEYYFIEKIASKIERKYRDKSNRNIPMFEVSKGSKRSKIDFFCMPYDLWYAADEGDSLINHKESLEFMLIKKDTTLYFYPPDMSRRNYGKVSNPIYLKQDSARMYLDDYFKD